MATDLLTKKSSGSGDIMSLLAGMGSLSSTFLGEGTKTSTTKSQTLDDALYAALAGNINNPEYTKSAAKADSQGAVDQKVKDIMEQYLPTVAQGAKGSGIYDDTTTSMLLNDLVTRAAGQGAVVQQQAIKDYADIYNTANVQTGQVLSGAKGTSTTVTKSAPAMDNASSSSLLMPLLGLGATVLAPKLIGGAADWLFGSSAQAATSAGSSLSGAFSGNGPLLAYQNATAPADTSGLLGGIFGDISSGISDAWNWLFN